MTPSPMPAAAASTSTTSGRCRAGRRRAGASMTGALGGAGWSRQSDRRRAGASMRLMAAPGRATSWSCREASAAAVGISSAEAERSLSGAGPRSLTANSKRGRGSSADMTEVRHIMGIPIGIDVRDPDGVDLEPAFDWLREVDAVFSTYRDDSEISRLDRGELTLAECRPEVDEVLTRCVALDRATRGYFSVRPAGRLDPSGLVKGWAVAVAAERLAAAGAEHFCINAGGDIVARGRAGAGRLWRDRHPAPGRPRPARRRARRRGPRGRHLRRVRAARAHPRSAHRPRHRPGCCRSPSSGRTSGRPTPTRPRRSPWAVTGPSWTATLAGYDAMCITSDHRVLQTPGFARHRVS